MGISIPHEDGPGQKRLGGTVSGSVQSTETFPARTARTSLTGLCSATSGVEVLLVGKNAFRYSSYVACGVVVAVEEATFAASTRRTDVTSTGMRNACASVTSSGSTTSVRGHGLSPSRVTSTW